MMKAFIRMWKGNSVVIETKELIIREGVKLNIDGEEIEMLLVLSGEAIYHPVLEVEVL